MNASLLIVTPAGPRSKSGNRTTAVRWQHLLEDSGNTVSVTSRYPDKGPVQGFDALVALHAYRSASAIDAFRHDHPNAPVVVALTGTDINEFIHSHPAETLRTIGEADALVCLHDAVAPLVPASARGKLHIIHQSAIAPAAPRRPVRRTFHICVIGHLREVKDPLRTAYAVRDLPDHSRICVTHYGAAHNDEWSQAALEEVASNRRYRWLGPQPQWQVRREFQRTRAMVLSSRSEGGANVIGEALVAGVPVLASRISGNTGLLGDDYAGYFEVGATDELRTLLLRIESEPGFLALLERQCAERAPMFSQSRERARWQALLASLLPAPWPNQQAAARTS